MAEAEGPPRQMSNNNMILVDLRCIDNSPNNVGRSVGRSSRYLKHQMHHFTWILGWHFEVKSWG
jgi:hypothetical protein